MADREKPEVHLQITSGVLRLSTDDAVYYISAPASEVSYPHPGVEHGMLTQDRAPNLPNAPAAPPLVTIDPALSDKSARSEEDLAAAEQAAREAEKEREYYRLVAQKYHHAVGALTRRVAEEPAPAPGREESGQDQPEAVQAAQERLGQALAEGQRIRDLLAPLTELRVLDPEEKSALTEGFGGRPEPAPDASPLIDRCREANRSSLDLLDQIAQTLAEPAQAPPPPPPPPPKKETKTVKRLFFPLNDLFQIVYELAVGEEVKKAIKVVWDKIEAFDEAQVNEILRPQAGSFEIDDGFVLVPLEPLFKALFLAATDESHKSTIKKLNANRQKLFLDQTLPVEERYEEFQEEVEVPGTPAPQPAPAPGPDLSQLKTKIDSLNKLLKNNLGELESYTPPPPEAGAAPPGLDKLMAMTLIQGAESMDLKGELNSALTLVSEHLAALEELRHSLGGLAESASPVPAGPSPATDTLLTLLGLLVEFDTRIKHAAELADSAEDVARKSVDGKIQEMRKKLGLGSGAAAGPDDRALDPTILNYLLTDMGF